MRDLQYMIDVMTAARDGKKIEQRWNGDQNWFVPPTNISWNWTHSEYRIAPEPRKPREWILHKNVSGDLVACDHPCCFVDGIRVREILPE